LQNGSRCPVCKYAELIEITLMVGDTELTHINCSACGTKWWHRDGEDTSLDVVIDLTSADAQTNRDSRKNSGRRRQRQGDAQAADMTTDTGAVSALADTQMDSPGG